MTLIQINAARLTTRQCWNITQRTMRVDPRCRLKQDTRIATEELYDYLQSIKADYYDGHFIMHTQHTAPVRSIMQSLIYGAYLKGYRDVADILGQKTQESDINVLHGESLRRAEFSAKTILETTKANLGITRGFLPGQKPKDAKDELENSWVFSEARAKAAADFEGTLGYNKASEGALRRMGGSQWMKGWAVSPDHDRDDTCDDNEAAGLIPLGEEFPSGDMTTPAHPNCECSVYYEKV